MSSNQNASSSSSSSPLSSPNDEAYKKQLLSRQLYTVGAEAQKKYAECDVLLVGLTGLGLEMAKNLTLSGVRSITLVDDSPIQWTDLSSMFYASPSDVGKPRAATLAPKISELNRFVNVSVASSGVASSGNNNNNNNIFVSDELLKKHTVAVFVDKRTTLLTEQNARCRALGVKMVCCESRGVACSIFVDAGAEEFTVLDKDGEETSLCVISDITPDGHIFLTDDKKPELYEGSKVYFFGLPGVHGQFLNSTIPDRKKKKSSSSSDSAEQEPVIKMFNITAKVNPFTFKIELPEGWDAATMPRLCIPGGGKDSVGGFLQTTKFPTQIKFKSLQESVAQPDFVDIIDDDPKMFASPALHNIFRAIHQVAENTHSDNVTNAIEDVVKLSKDFDVEIDTKLAENVAVAFHGNLNCMATFVGGIAAQEVLKLASGKFGPIQQWFYYDVRELVELRPKTGASEFAPRNTRYDGQIAVIGNTAQHKLFDASAFIVGAGALGCEHVKNAAMMGLSCGASQKGSITITDMDSIELSNLSRQFLFRMHHVEERRTKASVAAEAAREMNHSINIVSKELKVGADTENIFNENFWSRQSVVLNALDNVAARLYVDEQCVMNQRPLFESGTMGSKLNIQPVIPFLTENYGATRDPPEKEFAICTLKNFPNAIEHTIQWAKEAFGSEFGLIPSEVNNFIHDHATWKAAVARDPSAKAGVFKQIHDAVSNAPTSWTDCIAWARLKFEEYFASNIKQLMYNLPLDAVDDGKPVWGGAKRPPTAAVFNIEDETHFEFIVAAAALRATTFGLQKQIPASFELEEIKSILDSVVVPEWKPKKVEIAVKDDAAANQAHSEHQQDAITEKDLPNPATLKHLKLISQEFEKDDDTNFHVDFMTAVSNLRAMNYGIPTATRDRTKFIAGRIIPAMITSTAIATGLVCMEVLKYFLGANQLNQYRNVFINLAVPIFSLYSPTPAAKAKSYTTSEGKEISFTNWDRLDIGDGSRDLTLQEVVDFLKEKYDIDADMISTTTGKILYTGPFTKKEKLNTPITKILEQLGAPVKDDAETCALVAIGTSNEQEIDVPAVQYRFRGTAINSTARTTTD